MTETTWQLSNSCVPFRRQLIPPFPDGMWYVPSGTLAFSRAREMGATDFVVHYTAYGHAVPDRIFNLGSENNFPTYFSSVNLLACGVLLSFIYRSRSSSADGQEKHST